MSTVTKFFVGGLIELLSKKRRDYYSDKLTRALLAYWSLLGLKKIHWTSPLLRSYSVGVDWSLYCGLKRLTRVQRGPLSFTTAQNLLELKKVHRGSEGFNWVL